VRRFTSPLTSGGERISTACSTALMPQWRLATRAQATSFESIIMKTSPFKDLANVEIIAAELKRPTRLGTFTAGRERCPTRVAAGESRERGSSDCGGTFEVLFGSEPALVMVLVPLTLLRSRAGKAILLN